MISYEFTDAPSRPFIRLEESQRLAILQTLEDGWTSALRHAELRPNLPGVEMTQRLIAGMRNFLKGVVGWSREITIARGTELVVGPHVPRPGGLSDITIYFARIREEEGEHDPHAIIECKRVATNNARLCRLYVVEGIDRFAGGRYAGRRAFGFMAGYLLSGNATGVVSRINRYLMRQQRPTERLMTCSCPAHPQTWSSRHPRPMEEESVEIFHVFLGFPPWRTAGASA